jgi:serine/threonine protein kinase
MSPEIWANKPYDAKSDVWAVGCLIYELCMLSPPFLANDMNGLAAKIKTTNAPRVSKHYSEDLANLVALLLHKDPRARPSCAEVVRLLLGACTDKARASMADHATPQSGVAAASAHAPRARPPARGGAHAGARAHRPGGGARGARFWGRVGGAPAAHAQEGWGCRWAAQRGARTS